MNMNFTSKDVYNAIVSGNLDETKLIFESKPELINLITPLGSWLHIATKYGHLNIVKLLIDLGINLNIKVGTSMVTPLYIAAHEGNLDILNFFLINGAEFDVSEPDRNPLFGAIHTGQFDVAKRLIECGIDLSIHYSGASMNNMGAIDFCKEWGRADIENLINKTITK